jgi:hypothetical protein
MHIRVSDKLVQVVLIGVMTKGPEVRDMVIKMTIASFTEAVVSEGDIERSPCMQDGACKSTAKLMYTKAC